MVGIIALDGVAAETGVVMPVYLDEAYERRVREGRMATHHVDDSHGRRCHEADRLPMVGGMVSLTILTLLVIPVLYALWRGRSLLTESQSRPTGINL